MKAACNIELLDAVVKLMVLPKPMVCCSNLVAGMFTENLFTLISSHYRKRDLEVYWECCSYAVGFVKKKLVDRHEMTLYKNSSICILYKFNCNLDSHEHQLGFWQRDTHWGYYTYQMY